MPEHIDRVVLTACAGNGDVLAIVVLADGRCGVARDGTPVDGCAWDVGRVDECAAAFLRLCGLDDAAGGPTGDA